jgi:heptosyltransferase III
LTGLALVLVGAKEDGPLCDRMAQSWVGTALNLCGQLSPRETAAVMEGARVFCGPDSGPMHLASAVGVRCAGIFSARNKPGIWFPPGEGDQVVYHKVECFGCGLTKCVVEAKKCLMSVTVDEASQAILTASGLFNRSPQAEMKG